MSYTEEEPTETTKSPRLVPEYERQNERVDTGGPFLIVEWTGTAAEGEVTPEPIGKVLEQYGELLGHESRQDGDRPLHHSIGSFPNRVAMQAAEKAIQGQAPQLTRLKRSEIEEIRQVKTFDTLEAAEEWSRERA